MLYDVYEVQSAFVAPFRAMAGATASRLRDLQADGNDIRAFRYLGAACELVSPRAPRPTCVRRSVSSRAPEEVVYSTPFSTLLHFAKDTPRPDPACCVVAPLSGHFATLLRNTVRTLLADFDVYLTDWHNARDVPLDEGRFGFDEYVDDMIRVLEHLGPACPRRSRSASRASRRSRPRRDGAGRERPARAER